MNQSNFPNSLDYPDNSSYFSELSQEDWQKIKRYNSLLQKSTGLSEDEQAEMATIISELKGKRFTAQDINKLIDCIRQIEQTLYPISKKKYVEASKDGIKDTDFTPYFTLKSIDELSTTTKTGQFKADEYAGISLYIGENVYPDSTDSVYIRIYSDLEGNCFVRQDYKNSDDGWHSREESLINGNVDFSRLPVGTTEKSVAAGKHTHTLSEITDYTPSSGGDANTISGKGISDLFIKTSQYIRIEETDFNTVTTMGAYTIGTDNGSLMTESRNQPVGAYQWGTMVVFVSGGYGSVQMYFAHSGDVWIRGTFNSDFSQWNPWVKMGSSGSGTVDTSLFYKQLNSYGMDPSDSPIEVKTGYNKIVGGNINFGTTTKWGMNISKEDDASGNAQSLFVSNRSVYSYNICTDDFGDYNTFSTSRRTLSVGSPASVVIASYDTIPEDIKFSADYICSETNASSVIQSAINILTSGGKLLFLNGTYNITTPITIGTSNITIEGVGDSTQFYSKNVSGLFKIDKAFLKFLTFKSFKINGTEDYNNVLLYLNANVSDTRIENITYNYATVNEADFTLISRTDTKFLLSNAIITHCNFLSYTNTTLCIQDSIISNNIMTSSESPLASVHILGSNNIITCNKATFTQSNVNTNNILANNL